MAFKLGTYFSHHAGDPLKSGSLIGNLLKNGRDLIESVSGLGGRNGSSVKWQIGRAAVQPVRVVVKSNVSALSVVCRSKQPVVTLKSICHGLFRSTRQGTLASRYAQRITQLPYWSTFRSNNQFHSLGKRLATFSFVGMSLAVGSPNHQLILDDGFVTFDDVCSDIRNMFVAKRVCMPSLVNGDELCCATLEDLKFGNVLATRMESAVLEVNMKLNENNLVAENDTEVFSVEVISDQSVEQLRVDLLSDQSNIEDGLTFAVEMISNQQKQLSDIVQVVCNQNCRLSNLLNQSLDTRNMSTSKQLLDITDFSDSYSDCSIKVVDDWQESFAEVMDVEKECNVAKDITDIGDSNSDCSIEVMDDWQESFSKVMVVKKECNSDRDESSDCEDDDEMLELLTRLVELTKKQQRETLELERTITNQTKRLVSSISACKNDQDYKMAARVLWMTDRSIDYCNHIMMNELLPAAETTWRSPETWKLPSHFNVAPVIGGFLTTLNDVKRVASNCHNALPVIPEWQQDIAICIVTKRYEFTLAQYLASHSLTFRESAMLFLQLLEAVVHMNRNNVCHGNLNSENIYVEMLPDGPHLLVANFGSSFRIGTKFGLHFPKTEIWKCSHSYLMAPEVFSAGLSYWSHVDYTKADLWACGAIAYELFGCANPFRQVRDGKTLTSSRYHESDLPNLPDFVPSYINGLVKLLLKRDPQARPDPELVANVLHIGLWAPNQWQTSVARRLDIKRWLIQFAAVTFCYQSAHHQRMCLDGTRSIADTLKVLFLSRASLSVVAEAARLVGYNACNDY